MSDFKERIAAELISVRNRSLAYTDAEDDVLLRQHSPLMSPLVWDLAHVGNYEELWVLREAGGITPLRPEIDDMYDAFMHPRKDRPSLPMLAPVEARHYIEGVRGRVLDVLDKVDLHSPDPLHRGGFVFGLVIQHEHQHDETMLATLQLSKEPGLVRDGDLPPGRPGGAEEVFVPAGSFLMGTDTEPWAYDNERPAHRVDLPALLDRQAPRRQPRLRRLHRGGRLRRPAVVDPGGLALAAGEPRLRPAVLDQGRRHLVAYPLRPDRARAHGRARPARVLVRGRRLRPLGR